MNILIVAATKAEIENILPYLLKHKNVDYLITGIGMVATTYRLTKTLSEKKYDLCINIGIAGSFDNNLEIGDVVNVVCERFSEMGAEDGTNFIPLHKLNLEIPDNSVFSGDKINNYTSINNQILNELKIVNGITSNTIHGNRKSIDKIKRNFNPSIETMEGGAFMFVCKKEKINFIHLRAISNYVENRNKANWNVILALENLTKTTVDILNEIITKA